MFLRSKKKKKKGTKVSKVYLRRDSEVFFKLNFVERRATLRDNLPTPRAEENRSIDHRFAARPGPPRLSYTISYQEQSNLR